jgi:hypothetical protein
VTDNFPDIGDPTRHLTSPGDYSDRVGDAYGSIGGELGDIDSLWRMVTGWSLIEKVLEPVAGDWGRLFELRDVWNNLGAALTDVTDNLNNGDYTLEPHWQGNAASAFDAYMAGLTLAVLSEQEMASFYAKKLDDLGSLAEDTTRIVLSFLGLVVQSLGPREAEYVIPGWGQYKLYKDVKKLINTARDVLELESKFENAVELINSLSDLAHHTDVPNAPAVNPVPESSYGGPKSPGV